MKRVLFAAAIVWTGSSFQPLLADTVTLNDPLHGTICNASGAACNATEVGGVVPGSNFGPGATSPTFGFNSSPAGSTGELWISILIPTNQWTGTFPVLSSLGVDPGAQIPTMMNSGQPWTQGSPDLAVVMFGTGITANPANPFSAFQTPESLQDPGLTGFFVLGADIGPITVPGLNDQNATTTPDYFTFLSSSFYTGALPPGSAITAFLVNGTDVTSTAPSGQISPLAAPVPGPVVGAGLPGLVSALIGLWGLNWRRKRRVA